MLETLTKDELRLKIISLLKDDNRTLGQLGTIYEEIEIVESAGVTQSNWQLSLNTEADLTEAAKDAVRDAAEAAQTKWRIDLPYLGSSAHRMF